jgi:predicted MFS family arabinose efflux permease
LGAARRASGAPVHPLLDPALFRERSLTTGLIAQLAYFMGNGSYFLVLALYLQDGRHLDALQSGLVFLPIGVGYMASSLLARRRAARVGRQIIAVGAVLLVAGEVALLVTVSSIRSGGSMATLIAPLLIQAAGMGLVIGPLAQTILARVPAEHAGAAGGVLATAQQVGNAVGVAALGVVFYGPLGAGHPSQVAHAFSMSVIALLVIAVAVALLTQLMPRKTVAPSQAPTPTERPGPVRPSAAPASASTTG